MEAIAVFAAGMGIVWLVFWQIQHDRVRSIQEHRGLFRMRADTTAGVVTERREIGSESGLKRPARKESS
jgi:hypothetical protein